MATIFQILEKLQRVNLNAEVPVIIQRNSGEAVKLNRKQLYEKGRDVNGEKLTSYNSQTYALEKNKINPSPGLFTPDLYLTGAFQRGFYAQVKSGTTIIFGSTDMKTADLERKYTNKIFGLSVDGKAEFIRLTVLPEIHKYITGITGLKFS